MHQSRLGRLTALGLPALLCLAPPPASPRTAPFVEADAPALSARAARTPAPPAGGRPQAAPSPDLIAALPPSDLVTLVDYGQILGEVLPRLLPDQKALRDRVGREFEEARELTGLDARAMGRVATGTSLPAPSAAAQQPASEWVSVTRGLDYAGWLAFVRQRRPGALSEAAHAGKTFHVLRLSEKENERVEAVALVPWSAGEMAVAPLGGGAVAFGTPAAVRRALDAGGAGGPRLRADLAAAVTRRPRALIAAAGVMPPGLLSELLKGLPPEGGGFGKVVSSIEQFSAAVEVTAGGFAVTLTGTTGSAEQAKALGDFLTAVKTLAGLTPARRAHERLWSESFKAFAVSTSGPEVSLAAELPHSSVVEMVKHAAARQLNLSGRALKERGDLDAAVADFDAAIALDPEWGGPYINRARARADKGEFDAAIADLDKAVALEPDNAGAYNNRGFTRNEMGDFDRAVADLDKAIALDPLHAYAYNNRGRARAARGQLDEAMEDYDKSIALDPTNPLAYYYRAQARYQRGELERAVADLDKAIALEPAAVDAYADRGVARTDLGDYDAAIADFDKAISLNPKVAAFYNGRGLARYYKDELDAAVADFERAIALEPTAATIYSNRGLARLDQQDLGAALNDFEKAISIDPGLAEAHNGRGLVRVRREDFARSVLDFGKAVSLNPEYAEAYCHRALSLLWLGKDAEAARDLKKCSELDERLGATFELMAEEVREQRRAKSRRAH